MGQNRDKKPQDMEQIKLMTYHETLTVKMTPKFSNSRFSSYQSSLTLRIKQISTMWSTILLCSRRVLPLMTSLIYKSGGDATAVVTAMLTVS